jgi:LCP family protein required for cell wall assembly
MMKSLLKKLLIFLISLTAIVGTAVFAYGYFITQKMSKGDTEARKIDIDKPVNILLLGVDAGNYDNKRDNNHKRSDTIMIVRYNPNDEKVYILSIPRDTKVNINGRTEKINAAHAEGGTKLAISTIEKLLDVNINYYAKINYEGFRKCIDAIGGVDVVVPQDMDYDAYDIHIHFKKGETVHLNGEEAERFIRWRKNNNGGGYAMGDLGRIATQQEFMVKVLEKLKTPSGMIRIFPLINTLSEYVETNMDSKTMFAYAFKLKDIHTSNIEKRILEGEPKYIDGISYFIYNKSKNEEYLENFRYSNIGLGNTEIKRGDIKVEILNSTGVNGLASKYKSKMEDMGYDVVSVGNYSKKLKRSVINDYSKREYGNFVKEDLNFGEVVDKSSKKYRAHVVVILGEDVVK